MWFFLDGYFAPWQADPPYGQGLFLHPLPRPLRLLDTRHATACTLSNGYVVPECPKDPEETGIANAAAVGVPQSAHAVSLTAALITRGTGGKRHNAFVSVPINPWTLFLLLF